MNTPESTTTQFSDATDITTAVLTTVSDTTGRRIDELPALFDVVDPDALNSVFQTPRSGAPRSSVHLTFTFADCCISVHNSAVTVSPAAGRHQGPGPSGLRGGTERMARADATHSTARLPSGTAISGGNAHR